MENTPPQGKLEKLGIDVETHIHDSILTEGAAKSVRFRAVKVAGVSKPLGYTFGEVDKFVQNIVIPSLAWYQNKLHERDKAVFTLGEELDKVEYDKQSLAQQIQTMEYNASIRQGLQTFTEDKEVATLLARLKATETELEALKAGGAVPNTGEALTDEEKQQYLDAITERDTYITAVTEQYNQLEEEFNKLSANPVPQVDNATVDEKNQEIAALTAQIAALSATADNGEKEETIIAQAAHISAITDQYNQLMEQYSTLAADYETVSAAAVNVPVQEDNSEILKQYEDHISTITEQYNQLMEQYNTLNSNYEEALSQNATSAGVDDSTLKQYEDHISTITEQYNQLMEQYNTLNSNYEEALATQSVVPASGEVDPAVIAQYEEHISAITEQYNQLMEQYTTLNGMYETVSAGGAAPAATEDTQELYAYIETIKNQYEELSAAYTALQTASGNEAEVGSIRVELEAARAEITRLGIIISEYEAEEEEEDSKPVARIPFVTEKTETPLPPQFSKLPSGIRPEDLM